MDPHRNRFRLRRFYGAVASDQNRSILQWATGRRVLELGCGYGSLIQEARDFGREAVGLDMKGIQKLARFLGAERALCWRYLAKGILADEEEQG